MSRDVSRYAEFLLGSLTEPLTWAAALGCGLLMVFVGGTWRRRLLVLAIAAALIIPVRYAIVSRNWNIAGGSYEFELGRELVFALGFVIATLVMFFICRFFISGRGKDWFGRAD